MIEVREEPVPVRGWWREVPDTTTKSIRHLRDMGWETSLLDAMDNIDLMDEGDELIFQLSNGQIVIVRAKK